MSNTLPIQIWSDIACPWCYLGKRRLDAALAQFPHRAAVKITWKAFELDRNAPAVYPTKPDYIERLANKYRFPTARAAQMIREMTERGANEGVEFHFDRVRGVNTFAAHQVTTYAGHLPDADVQHAFAERLFRAYFTEGKVLSDHETLGELAKDVGLDDSAVKVILDGGNYIGETRSEEDEASQLGVSGVPFFVIGGYAVEGAQSTDLMLRVLQQAWQEIDVSEGVQVEEGASCSPDGC